MLDEIANTLGLKKRPVGRGAEAIDELISAAIDYDEFDEDEQEADDED